MSEKPEREIIQPEVVYLAELYPGHQPREQYLRYQLSQRINPLNTDEAWNGAGLSDRDDE